MKEKLYKALTWFWPKRTFWYFVIVYYLLYWLYQIRFAGILLSPILFGYSIKLIRTVSLKKFQVPTSIETIDLIRGVKYSLFVLALTFLSMIAALFPLVFQFESINKEFVWIYVSIYIFVLLDLIYFPSIVIYSKTFSVKSLFNLQNYKSVISSNWLLILLVTLLSLISFGLNLLLPENLRYMVLYSVSPFFFFVCNVISGTFNVDDVV